MTRPSAFADIGPVVPVLVTPLRADATIDWAAMTQQVSTLRALGVTWVALGYASEVEKLQPSQIVDLVSVARSAGLAVMSGVELNPSVEHHGRAAIAAGAAALLVRPAEPAGPEPAEVGRALHRLAVALDVPLVYQDAAQHTGVDVPAETLVDWLARVPQLAAKLEGDTAVSKIGLVRRLAGPDPVLLGGRGGRCYLDELRAGVDSTMPGPGFVDVFAAITRLVRRGDVARASALDDALAPFHSAAASSMSEFIVQQQHLLRRRFGIPLVPRTLDIDAAAARAGGASVEALLRATGLPELLAPDLPTNARP